MREVAKSDTKRGAWNEVRDGYSVRTDIHGREGEQRSAAGSRKVMGAGSCENPKTEVVPSVSEFEV